MERIPLPWRALTDAIGELPAGVHGLSGPIGVGKTQLALQIAAHAAEQGAAVTLVHPRVPPAEIGARLHGIGIRAPWCDAASDALPPRITLATIERIPKGTSLIVVDHYKEEAVVLERARAATLEQSVAVIVVLEPKNPSAVRAAVPAELRDAPGPELADWIGISARSASELDTLLVLAPTRPKVQAGWSAVDVVVSKHRRGLPARAPLRFNGTWFEDEQELELHLG